MTVKEKLSDEFFKCFRVGCTFTDNKSNIVSSDFSEDGKVFITCSESEKLYVMDALKGTEKGYVDLKKYGVNLMKHTYGKSVLHSSTKQNHDLRMLDIESRNYVRYYVGHQKKVTSLVISPGNQDIFASGSEDKTVRIWDFRKSHCSGKLLTNTTNPIVEFEPSGMFFSIGFENNTIKMYDMRMYKDKAHFKEIKIVREAGVEPNQMKYSRDGTKLLIGTNSSVIKIHDATSGLPLADLKGFMNSNRTSIIEATFTRDSQYIMSGSTDGIVHIWSTNDFLKVASLQSNCAKPIRFAKFNPKFMMFATCSDTVHFWIPVPIIKSEMQQFQ